MNDVIIDAAKAAPPAAVTGVSLYGIGLGDISYAVTIVYVGFMLFFLLRDKWWRQRK